MNDNINEMSRNKDVISRKKIKFSHREYNFVFFLQNGYKMCIFIISWGKSSVYVIIYQLDGCNII